MPEMKGLSGGVPSDVGQYDISGKLGEMHLGVVLKGTLEAAAEGRGQGARDGRMQQADDIERVGREIQI